MSVPLRQWLIVIALIGAATPANAQLNAAFVCQSVPEKMIPGQDYAVSVTMRNAGTGAGVEWNSLTYHKLAPEGFINLWGVNRVNMSPPGERIASGKEKTFSFRVKAPSSGSSATFRWRMLNDGPSSAYFGAYSTAQTVHLVPRQDVPWNARPIKSVSPCTMTAGKVYTVEVAFQNNGDAAVGSAVTWTTSNAALKNDTTTNWGISQVAIAAGESFKPYEASYAPRSVKLFRFEVTAPSTPGVYPFRWRMVKLPGGTEFFGDASHLTQITVVPSSQRLIADTLDYLLNDHSQGADGVCPSPSGCGLDGKHGLSQTITGNKMYEAYFGQLLDPSIPRPDFLLYSWDDTYIYLLEDTAPDDFPYANVPGIWMKRYMDVGASAPDASIDMSQNQLQRFVPGPNADGTGESAGRCAAMPHISWGYTNTLESVETINLGGTIGAQEVIKLKYAWPGGCERFYYSREWGTIRHERYNDGTCTTLGPFQDFNTLMSPKRVPDLSRSCLVPPPLLQY